MAAKLRPLLSTMTPPAFNDLLYEVSKRLEYGGPEEASDAWDALGRLQATYPSPPTEIVDAEVCEREKSFVRINTHATTCVADAIHNIRASGRAFTTADERPLRLILTHWCGWSATKSRHRNDAWVNYIRQLYRDVPILDSVACPEDLVHYPADHCSPEPSLFLLATRTSYYVFDWEDMGLCLAGTTLKEVYTGLREMKHKDPDGWPVVPWSDTRPEEGSRNCFPSYELYSESQFKAMEEASSRPFKSFHGKDGAVFVLRYPLKDLATLDPHQDLDEFSNFIA